jgi:hypothetical protein
MSEEIEIKKLEDIKDYMKLLLISVPISTFKQTNPSCINVGAVKEINDYYDIS